MIRIKNHGWFYTLVGCAAVNFCFILVGIFFLLSGGDWNGYTFVMSAVSTAFPLVAAYNVHTERTDEEPLRKVGIDE